MENILNIYIYTYIYIYVCVCVRTRVRMCVKEECANICKKRGWWWEKFKTEKTWKIRIKKLTDKQITMREFRPREMWKEKEKEKLCLSEEKENRKKEKKKIKKEENKKFNSDIPTGNILWRTPRLLILFILFSPNWFIRGKQCFIRNDEIAIIIAPVILVRLCCCTRIWEQTLARWYGKSALVHSAGILSFYLSLPPTRHDLIHGQKPECRLKWG